MKKVFLLIVGIASFAAVNAQTKFGVKAGANFASLTDDLDEGDTKIGLNAGVFGRFHLAGGLSVQPELVFSSQGMKVESEGDDIKYNLNYLNIPIMFQYKIVSGLYAETGPQIGFLMSAKAKAGSEDEDIKDYFKGTDFSWGFGAGYETDFGLGINARFNLGLANILEGDSESKTKNSVIQVGLAYSLNSLLGKK